MDLSSLLTVIILWKVPDKMLCVSYPTVWSRVVLEKLSYFVKRVCYRHIILPSPKVFSF
jgi:hypothetical protein